MNTLIILTKDEQINNEFINTWGQLTNNCGQIDVGRNKILLIRRCREKTPEMITNEIKENLSKDTKRIGVLYHQPFNADINKIISVNYLDKYDFISMYSLAYSPHIEKLAEEKSVICYERLWNYYNRKSPLNLTLDILYLALYKDGAEEVKRNRDNYPVIYSDKAEEFISKLTDSVDTLYRDNYNNLRDHLLQTLSEMKCL